MNKIRRKQLKRWLKEMETIKNELESICLDEEEAFDNMPEGIQSSENGMNSENAIDQMNEAASLIDDAISCIEELV